MNRFRPLILSLILAAAAFGLTRLNATLQASPPVISGASGSVLFASAFDDTEREWETFDGRLSSTVGGGILKIDVGTENSAPFVPARWHFADFDLTVLAGSAGGPLLNGYGVMFRLKDVGNYYRFVISSDGYYQVIRAVDGQEREISDDNLSSEAIITGHGAFNTIRVVAHGENFQFYVNGTLLPLCITNDPNAQSTYVQGECLEGSMTDTLVDTTHATGRIGLTGVSGMEPDVSVVFDNLVILQP